MQKFLGYFLVFFLLSCKKEKLNAVDVSDVKIEFKLMRFDREFYRPDKKLSQLKRQFPFLFPKEIPDSVWQNKRSDKYELELFSETQKLYKSTANLKAELSNLFKHIKHYKATFKSPMVITLLTNIDYDNRVIYADSLLFISLDAYLGSKHKFYDDYPNYIKQNSRSEHIKVDVALQIINQQVVAKNNRTFIDKIICEGKKMYLLDKYLPEVSDSEKMGYSIEKNQWILDHEEFIWRYFVEKELLFSTANSLDRRFLDLAPFSKFYTDYDNLSPGRVGVWIGWQIVRSYMKNNNVSLHKLLSADQEEVYKKSKYRPKKL
ncbi:MAG: gliding motility lipoprotein GldB [Tenacibaculum sp.]